MDIDQARIFLAITEHGSFQEAAKHIHVTQSTINAQIQNLETELGAKLFLRNKAGAPEFSFSTYMVFTRMSDSDVIPQAVEDLRELALKEQERNLK